MPSVNDDGAFSASKPMPMLLPVGKLELNVDSLRLARSFSRSAEAAPKFDCGDGVPSSDGSSEAREEKVSAAEW